MAEVLIKAPTRDHLLCMHAEIAKLGWQGMQAEMVGWPPYVHQQAA